jgi:hypothetical protein
MTGRGADDLTNGVAAAVDELYGLPLGQFTAVRTERAKQARAEGDRNAAAVIAKLPKPNVVAWLANQVARQNPDDLRPLLELGESLRQATADLDAARLGELSRQQRQIMSALIGRARELADEARQVISESTLRGLEDTMHAALVDEQAAEDLLRGQLAAGLSRTGFPGLDDAADAGDLTAVLAAPAQKQVRPTASGKSDRAAGSGRKATGTTQRTRKVATDRREEAARTAAEVRRQQLERAQRAEADARADASEADRDQDRARATLADAESATGQAEETIGRLQHELDAALEARNNAGRAQRQARKYADRADRTARQAARRLTEATSRLKELERHA